MTDQTPYDSGRILLQRTANVALRAKVICESERFWLHRRPMAELLGVNVRSISYPLKQGYTSGDLGPQATLRRIWRVQHDGQCEVGRETELHMLEGILSVGCRVNGAQAEQSSCGATGVDRDSAAVVGRRAVARRRPELHCPHYHQEEP